MTGDQLCDKITRGELLIQCANGKEKLLLYNLLHSIGVPLGRVARIMVDTQVVRCPESLYVANSKEDHYVTAYTNFLGRFHKMTRLSFKELMEEYGEEEDRLDEADIEGAFSKMFS